MRPKPDPSLWIVMIAGTIGGLLGAGSALLVIKIVEALT